MKRAYFILRCGILWAISSLHFFLGTLLLLFLALFIDPRKNDRPQRIFARNILRLALWEFRWNQETPVKVAINEAVELAKRYSSDSAPRFINGVLGTLAVEA